jgi:proline racemase
MTPIDVTRVLDTPSWALPSHGLRIDTVEAHCGGEPMQVVLGGFPMPIGRSLLDRRLHAEQNFDHLRRAIVLEPRGHSHQSACLLTPPTTHGAQCGALFFDGAGWGTMSGHGIITLATVLVETGFVPMVGPETRLKIDTVAGLVRCYARVEGDRVRSVFFENVPSFVTGIDETITVPGLGEVKYDLAFGGVFYAFVEASTLGLSCGPEQIGALRKAGLAIQEKLSQQKVAEHPEHPALSFLGGVVFYDEPPRRKGAARFADTRHACIFANGSINRCPGPAAVSARLTLLLARNQIEFGQAVLVESVIGSTCTGKAGQVVEIYGGQAIVTEVEATAYITGRRSLFIDSEDTLLNGFVLQSPDV